MYRYILIALVFMLLGLFVNAQNDENKRGKPKRLLVTAINQKNGPVSVRLELEYEFWKETFDGQKFYLGISYKTIRLSYEQNAGFRMHEKVYLPNVLMSQDSRGYQGFDKIQVKDLQLPLHIPILGKDFTYNSNYSSRSQLGLIGKNDDINSFVLQSLTNGVDFVIWGNDDELRERVEALAKRNAQNSSPAQNQNRPVTGNAVQNSSPGMTVESSNTNNRPAANQNTNTFNNYNNNTVNSTLNSSVNKAVNNTVNRSPTPAEITELIQNQRTQSQQLVNAVDESMNKLTNDFRAMGSYNQSIEDSKKRLNEVSQLSGNYNSVEEIEREFASKMSSIKGITNNIESQQNAKLNYAVASRFNANATEMAIGQGLNLVGNIINGAKAARDAREAAEALRLQREAEIKRFEEEKRKAILGMRNELFKRFPDGNPPPPSFKTDRTTLYFFSYMTDKSKIEDVSPSIAVTSIFPITKFDDGSFPYKASILNKLNGLAPGSISIVGPFETPEKVEEIRKLFVRLAESSKFIVKNIQLKNTAQTGLSRTGNTSTDFWENGKTKDSTQVKKVEKKGSFWDN